MAAAAPRLTLNALRSLRSAEPICASMRWRAAQRRTSLHAFGDRIPQLESVVSTLDTAYLAFEDPAPSPEAALLQLDESSWKVAEQMRLLPDPLRLGESSQSLLQDCFSLLIAGRVLLQRCKDINAQENGEEVEPMSLLDFERLPTLPNLLEMLAEDARAFCREKHGDAPEVEIIEALGDSSQPVLVPAYVEYAATELLKNAMGAHVHEVGAYSIDQLPAVTVRFGVKDGWASVAVTDYGGGWRKPESMRKARRFLMSTHAPRDPNYTYSRDFGASPFEGMGMGLPLAALHASYLGGSLRLGGLPGIGVQAYLTFDVSGERTDPAAFVHSALARGGSLMDASQKLTSVCRPVITPLAGGLLEG